MVVLGVLVLVLLLVVLVLVLAVVVVVVVLVLLVAVVLLVLVLLLLVLLVSLVCNDPSDLDEKRKPHMLANFLRICPVERLKELWVWSLMMMNLLKLSLLGAVVM